MLLGPRWRSIWCHFNEFGKTYQILDTKYPGTVVHEKLPLAAFHADEWRSMHCRDNTVNLHAFISNEIKQAGCWEADITVEKVAFPLRVFGCINSAEPY